MVQEIWLSKKKKNNNREEESSDLPACHISETVSSLFLKLGLHFVVGSSRLDNYSQYLLLSPSGGTRISLCISP